MTKKALQNHTLNRAGETYYERHYKSAGFKT